LPPGFFLHHSKFVGLRDDKEKRLNFCTKVSRTSSLHCWLGFNPIEYPEETPLGSDNFQTGAFSKLQNILPTAFSVAPEAR
jgi:hypothetical protein